MVLGSLGGWGPWLVSLWGSRVFEGEGVLGFAVGGGSSGVENPISWVEEMKGCFVVVGGGWGLGVLWVGLS